MSNKYRVPTEDEFVQDFKFEVKTEGRNGILDIKTGEFTKSEPWEFWTPTFVFWMSGNEFEDKWNKPFDVKTFLEKGLIRVKV